MRTIYLSIIAVLATGAMMLTLFLPAAFEQVEHPLNSVLLLSLQQFGSGTPAMSAPCNEDIKRVTRAEDGSHGCVTRETAKMLIEHGRTKKIDSSDNSVIKTMPTISDTGIIVPLYSYPYLDNGTFYWKIINDTKNKYPHVPFFAVINPNNGFVNGCAPDGINFTTTDLLNYQRATANLTKSGVVVLGYVSTGWGSQSLPWVESQIKNYTSCIPSVNGIMLDEMQSNSGMESYYWTLTNYIHSLGLKYSIGNPGQDISPSYIGTVDVLNIAETNGLYPDNGTTNSGLSGKNYWHLNFPKDKFSMVVPGINDLSTVASRIKGSAMYVGLMFITNDTDSNYGPIPPYLSAEVGYLNFSSSLTTIKSVDSHGKEIAGLYIQVNQSANQIPSGYTPLRYGTATGVTYQFTPESGQNCLFDYWQDTGSHIASRSILANITNATFTAVYKNNGTDKCHSLAS